MADTTTVERFITALRELEGDGEAGPLVELFADDAELDTATGTPDLHGKDGARRLWTEDRRCFDEVRSEFRNVVVDGDRAALEWTREATTPDGRPLRYQGVSLLELDGARIRRFSTYFDPHALTRAHAA